MTEVSASTRVRLCVEDILRKRMPLFDGIETLLQLTPHVPALEGDRDLHRLAELLAKADHLPIGAARAHWNREALHRIDRELLALERSHEDSVFYACRRLLETLQA